MAASLQKAQMHDDRVHGARKVKVTILASEWGSSKGALSTLNRELAIQLAKFPEVEITFFLPKCSQQEKQVALNYNVKIVEAKPVPGMEELNWLCFPPDDLQIDIIVGHGAELGSQAYAIKGNKKCKWVQVVHTDPEELGMFKNNSNPILKGEEKHKTEVELCEMADHVLGVGEKLSEAFRLYLRGCNKDDNVFAFTPGLFEEFGAVKQVPSERQLRTVLVFGRGDVEDFELKGFDIAGKAIAALQDTRLVFVGDGIHGKREEIAKRLAGCGVPESRLRVRGFVQDQESLKRLFQEVDLVVMPSRTEGFGLKGLEAMSAGLPVLVSHNSGFGEALRRVPFGSFFVVNSENPADWTQAIQEIWAKDRKSRLEEVKTLQDSYGRKYNWAEQIKDLIDKMTSLAYENSLEAAGSLETKFNASSQRMDGMTENHEELSMENDNIPKTNSSDDEQLVSETYIGSNCEKKADAAPGNQTEVSTNRGSLSQNSRKRKMSESSCDQGKSYMLKLKIRQQNLDVEQNRKFKEHFLGQIQLLLELDTLDFTEQSQGEATSFFQGLQKSYNLLVRNFGIGCLEITVECVNLEGLERLWNDYQSGALNDLAESCLVTDELKKKLNVETVQLKTSIAEESYVCCKEALMEMSRKSHSCYTPPKSERILNITVATTAEGWNIIANEQLAIELAKNPRLKVYGLVLRNTQEQRFEAKKSNIELVDSRKMIGNYTEEDLIAYPPDSLDVDVLIIHSYPSDLGKQAQVIKEKKNCKWVHVVHTISEELELYTKKASNPGKADSEKKPEHEVQVALCEAADIVIAIGPKVADAYKTALRHCGKHKNVITMTPAIIDHDLLGVQGMGDGGEKFRVLISATYPSKYFEVKGCHIAAEAIKSLQDSSYHLIFVVLPDDGTEYLRDQLKGLISLNQINIRPVSRSNEEWRKQLCQVDLVILPSVEGFGTSCVRAISAGVPVLSSGKSGFGMALKKLPSGEMHVLDSEKPQDWADKIRELRDKGPTQLAREAKQLREEYMREYCWKDQCDKLVDILMEIVPSKEESQKVGAEHTECTESRMHQLEVKDLRKQEHDTADDVTNRLQELDLGDKNPDGRMGQENEEFVESVVDKALMPQQEEVVGVTKTSVEETGVTDQKSDSLAQKNIACDAVDGGVSLQTKRMRLSTKVDNIPYPLLRDICSKLNALSCDGFSDFQILGERMEIERNFIEICAQPRNRNPTYEILKHWCQKTREPTVGKLIEILKHKDLQRMDVVQTLENWVEHGDSK